VMCVGAGWMVGRDSVVPSGGGAARAAVDARPWTGEQVDDREPDYDDERGSTSSDVSSCGCDVVDVDAVRLLTRRLSVTPPTDDDDDRGCSAATAADGHDCTRHTTAAGASTEVDINRFLPSLPPLSLTIFHSPFIHHKMVAEQKKQRKNLTKSQLILNRHEFNSSSSSFIRPAGDLGCFKCPSCAKPYISAS